MSAPLCQACLPRALGVLCGLAPRRSSALRSQGGCPGRGSLRRGNSRRACREEDGAAEAWEDRLALSLSVSAAAGVRRAGKGCVLWEVTEPLTTRVWWGRFRPLNLPGAWKEPHLLSLQVSVIREQLTSSVFFSSLSQRVIY